MFVFLVSIRQMSDDDNDSDDDVMIIVTKQELTKLFTNFKKLDRNGDGFLSKDEFLQIEALQQNPLVARVLEIFDDDGNDKIDFTEFVSALSIFCSTDDENNKAKVDCMFFKNYYFLFLNNKLNEMLNHK